MACFLAPATEAVVTTIIKKSVEKKEKAMMSNVDLQETQVTENEKISWGEKLGWLNKMLWGGSFLLLIEHIWHGEIVPWPPFLTAMSNAADARAMLMEIATVGTTMAALITTVWAVVVGVVHIKERDSKEKTERIKE